MEDEPTGPAIWIDYREKLLLDAFPEAEHRNLELGDVQFALNNSAVMILERKTIADLAQSVKDNRYREQKKRLLAYRQLHPHVKLVYVIEGFYHFDSEFRCKNMSNATLSSCIINSMFRDGIYVMLTKNIQDTIQFLQQIKRKFNEDPTVYSNVLPHMVESEDYTSVVTANVKSRKRDNIDTQTCFLMQLSCIPGISSKKATDIQDYMQVYHMNALLERLRNEGAISLESVPGIGKVLATNVYEFLCGG